MINKETSFYVTNRSFEQLSPYLDLSDAFIQNLPEKARVLEVGSGVFRNFAAGLSAKRPDLQVISLDPTLAISKKDFLSVVERDQKGDIQSIYYTNKIIDNNKDYYFAGKDEDPQKVREERLKGSDGLAVAAFAPNLPFKDGAFDLIVDTFGPGLYLHEEGEKEFKKYLTNVFNILKVGGEVRIFPVIKSNLRYRNLEELRNKSQKYYLDIIEALGLSCEVSFKEIPQSQGSETKEILMIIKKK